MATDRLQHLATAFSQPALSGKLRRREWLALMPALFAGPLPFVAHATTDFSRFRIAATWQNENPGTRAYSVGVLAPQGDAMEVTSALDVSSRAHGLWLEAGGTLLVVARRPGDWLLRWKPGDGKASNKVWVEADRAFNGHVITSADGKTLYTTETNLETGQGLIGVRDAADLQKRAEWTTGGMDPHELLLDLDGSLMVANGGIPASPETGRLKLNMERMDASLVRLDASSGQTLGQWRLPDQRLSLRHMAWGNVAANGKRLLGIALQAEHDDLQVKSAAPVLALFDGARLRAVQAAPSAALEGYGGDIAFAAGYFAVSCPRANGVGLWDADGQWQGFAALDEACALAGASAQSLEHGNAPTRLWVGGRHTVLALDAAGKNAHKKLRALRLDNHWVAMA